TLVFMEENIEKRYYAYFEDLAERLIPISKMVTMASVESMLAKWTTGQIKKNTLIVEPPDWAGNNLRSGADPVKVYTGAICVVSPGRYTNEQEVQAIMQEVDLILDQLLARMIEDSAESYKRLMRNVGDEVD